MLNRLKRVMPINDLLPFQKEYQNLSHSCMRKQTLSNIKNLIENKIGKRKYSSI